MSTRKMRKWVLVAVAIVNIAALSVTADERNPPKEFTITVDGWGPSKDYLEVHNRITNLRTRENLSEVELQNRMEQLVALVQEIEDRWRHTDVVSYARLTRKACGTLASLNLADSRQHSLAQNLAQDFAMRALHKADDMPLDVECNFLYGVRQDGFVNGKPFEGEARAQLRRRQTALWLHAWQRIDATIDKNWDPDDTGVSRVPPPWSTGLPAGVAPSAIKDPQLRAQYEAAIEANCQKNARYSLQYRARLLKKSWIPNAERFIFRIYTEPPARPAELEALLNEYIADADKRRRILHAVETKKLPDDLIRTRKRPRSAK